jgi:hypothetical protein
VIRPTTVVIGKLNDGVGVVPGHAVMSEQGVHEGTEYAPLRGPHVEDQRGGYVITYPYHLWLARQEVQDPAAEGGVSPRVLSLVMSFEITMVLNTEL